MSTDDGKYCIDCKHFVERPRLIGRALRLCGHPTVRHPVTGEPTEFCGHVRHYTRPCGPHGQLFEPIRPAPKQEPAPPVAQPIREPETCS